MTALIQKKYLSIGIAGALALETISFIAFFIPALDVVLAIMLVVLFLLATIRDLRLGIFLLYTELAIGGHGYFISLSAHGFDLAMRHIWFIILISVFTVKHHAFILKSIKNSNLIKRLIFVGIIVVFAVLLGYVNGYPFSDIFSDGNAYIFYLLAFPLLYVSEKLKKEELLNVLFGALVILSIKTIVTLSIFSNGLIISSEWYYWVRDLRFGEITYINLSFFI